MQEAGLFITVEGIDGAGKSSHIARMADWWRARGRTVGLSREPGGTPLGEALRELILQQPMDTLTESLLAFAARREHLLQVIEPALARGEVLISDRFTDATFAYQGGGRGFDRHILSQLQDWVQASAPLGRLRQPDLTLWFVLDPAVAAQRLQQARVPDKFEAQSQTFFRAVHEAYAQRAAQYPDRFVAIDASQSMAQVGEQVLQALQDFAARSKPRPSAQGGA
jgi:dTMP kinase